MSVRDSDASRPRPERPNRRRRYLAADERRREILEVAKAVFARRGYHVASVADLCKAARIARGTLYVYFDNKHDVLVAILQQTDERLRDLIATRPQLALGDAPVLPPPELLAAFCQQRLRATLEVLLADEPLLRVLVRCRGIDRTVDQLLGSIEHRLLGTLEGDIRVAQQVGLFRAGEPGAIARLVFGGVEKIVQARLLDGAALDLDALVPLIVELQLFGVVDAAALPGARSV